MKWLLALLFSSALFGEQLCLHNNQLDESLMKKLIELFHVGVLVETGTWVGQTAQRGAPFFKDVYTAELSPQQAAICQEVLAPFPNVHFYSSDSPAFLRMVIPKIEGRILFWLDAHFCGGNSAGKDFATPIEQELAAIRSTGLTNGIILIDDIRHFHGLPKDFPEYGDYPFLSEIKRQILAINPSYQFWILGDMAIAYPMQDCVDVSPLVRSCTTSRLFESGEKVEEVLAAELAIRELANAEEAKMIDALQRYVRRDQTAITTAHLALWKGLLEMGRRRYGEAAQKFQQVLSAGYTHWRVLWYLAEVEYLRRNWDHSALLLKQVLEKVPDFAPARELLTKVSKYSWRS